MSTKQLEKTLLNLRLNLLAIEPKHDTPIGLVHPYWARKPLNLIDAIIKCLSKKGDIIFDPFVGSGTIPFAAITNQRRAIASDLNPLAIYLTKTVLDLGNFNIDESKFITSFFKKLENKYSHWFLINKNQIIERIRYSVKGNYKDGNFSLIPTEVILKQLKGIDWRGRTAKKISKRFSFSHKDDLVNFPINFDKIRLLENSRIAIPKGALASHFFDHANRATINCIHTEIKKTKAPIKIKNALFLILSSSLPLLRLSDKKASSQWPYWRPKTSLTSRNPLFVLRKRVISFLNAINWVHSYSDKGINFSIKNKTQGYHVFESAAQDVMINGLKAESIDLIITDPPYADHAPYLEYSELWNRLILGCSGKSKFNKEIVKTDAPSRNNDDESYIDRLCKSLESCCKTLKYDGFLVFFYQDKTFAHWAAIRKALIANNVRVLDVLALTKQRRSMKTITSPGRTLDGDLLIVAQKSCSAVDVDIKRINSEFLHHSPKPPDRATLFSKYAELIREGLIHGNFDELVGNNSDIYTMF